MKTLFISDLDGTLLNSDKKISSFASKTINRLIVDGVNFTVATARTYYTASVMLDSLNLNLPIVLQNGVAIYDIKQKKFLDIEYIEKSSAKFLIDCIHGFNSSGFVYTIENDDLIPYYEAIESQAAHDFVSEREIKYNKRFYKVKDFMDIELSKVVYYSVTDGYDSLKPLFDCLLESRRFNVEFYQDVYSKHLWYLEVLSQNASKYTALQKLKNRFSFDRVISFGDNINDIPMFSASDISIAVENANDNVKVRADFVIDSNDKEGVANWLNINAKKYKP